MCFKFSIQGCKLHTLWKNDQYVQFYSITIKIQNDTHNRYHNQYNCLLHQRSYTNIHNSVYFKQYVTFVLMEIKQHAFQNINTKYQQKYTYSVYHHWVLLYFLVKHFSYGVVFVKTTSSFANMTTCIFVYIPSHRCKRAQNQLWLTNNGAN